MDNNATVQTIKLALATGGGLFIRAMGGGSGILNVLLGLIVFDFVLGMLKGIKTKNFSSSIMRWGAVNKAIELAVIAVFNLFDNAMSVDIFRNAATVWFCICEGASLFENMGALGVPWPPGISDVLMKLKTGVSVSFVDMFDKVVSEKLSLESKDSVDEEDKK